MGGTVGLPFLIQRASQILTALFVAQSGDQDATLPQFHLLNALARGGERPQIDLARKTGIDAATTGLILGNLVRSGWVKRRVAPDDARRKLVGITDAGRLALAAADECSRAVDRRVAAALGEDMRALSQLLDKYAFRGGPSAADLAEPEDPPCRLALKLRGCLQISERILADLVGPLGLTMRQFAVLYVLRALPGLTKADIIRLLGYERSNAALVMQILQSKGSLEPLDTQRQRRFHLTLPGEELLMESYQRAFGADRALNRGLDEAETVLLQRLLGEIICAFDGGMRQPLSDFVDIQSRPEWPVPTAPAPSFLVGRPDRQRPSTKP